MTCRRCQGEVGEAQFLDLELTQDIMWMRGWRCSDCGHAIDPSREASRRLRASNQRAWAHIWKPEEWPTN
jgi:DNA-directed RNA polymerase subunit RPC12/RpoP